MQNIQQQLDNAVKAGRAQSLATSPQLTLGELLLKLEPIVKKQEGAEGDDCANVCYDFEYLYPTDIDSWRGSYAELALNFKSDQADQMTVTKFYEMLKGCLGKTFEGYKGGDFLMSKHTPIWVANYGNSGNTGVIDILDNGYEVVLITGLCEY